MEILLGVVLEALLPAVVAILEMIFGVILQILLGLLLIPVVITLCCIVSTPVVLTSAAFGAGEYLEKVAAGYRTVIAAASFVGV